MPANRGKKPYSRPTHAGRSDGEWLHDRAPGSKTDRTTTKNGLEVLDVPNTKLQVSNLHYEVTPKDLTQIFGQLGTLVREPLIRYDRSGRSSGIAIIFYETAAEAKKAMQHFDKKLCKGQPMSISFDSGPPARKPRRVNSAPSLLNRIEKPALLDRLGSGEPKPSPSTQSSGGGPVRSKTVKPREPKGGPREKKVKSAPKSAAELDMELDSFMKDDSKPAAVSEDVEMAA